ncbi:hypothetical protein H6P81_002016 [Aristolochia fimbriata]|uniref:Uncharacterized protein n=1 Tax=Aristolochia fimbriata TaxID=158543 RepID=A0AAV7F8T3_ARIFI|nr:hypothetical protein H6P81_002016 [Aristolochia fimbriata]
MTKKKKVAPSTAVQPSDAAESVDTVPQPAMAKKNLSSDVHSPIPDSEEKTKNLQALNSMLVRQTVELRQQVDSLKTSKDSLQSDLDRFASMVRDLKSSSSLFQDQTIEFEVQDSVSRICVANALQEMVSAAEKVKEELAQKLLSSEDQKRGLEEEMARRCRDLEGQMEMITAGRREVEVQLEALRKQRERFLREFGKATLDENDLDMDDYGGKDSDDFDSVLAYFEQFALKMKMLKSEKQCVELQKADSESELSKLRGEVDRLQSEVSSGTEALECVIREKDNLDKVLEEFKKKLAKRNAEKEELERITAEKDGKIDELNATIKQFKANISSLQRELAERETLHREELSRVLSEGDSLKENLASLQHREESLRLEFSKLEEESSKDKEALAQLTAELVRNFDAMREAKVLAGNKLEDSLKELDTLSRVMREIVEEKEAVEKARAEIQVEMVELRGKCIEQEETNTRLHGEVVRLQDENALTLDEKDNLQKKLVAQTETARRDLQNLQTRAEEGELILNRALSMLRETVEMMGRPEGEEAAVENVEAEEDVLGSFTMELEAIKKIFKAKDMEVENLSKDLTSLQVASYAQKKLCLWSWVSSAAVIIAASIAYITRGR